MTQTDQERAHNNWSQTPRPFSFIRPRFHRDTAEWLRDLLQDEKDAEFERLGKYRTEGRPESDADVQEVRANLNYCITILRDLDRGLVEMVGPRVPRDEP